MNHRIAIITGGSRGLGKSMALHLADRGVGSIITYRNSGQEASQVVSTIVGKGVPAASLQLDVGLCASFPDFRQRVAEVLEREFKRRDFDYLVNNAGAGTQVPFLETSEEQFDDMMRTHLKGTFFLTQMLAHQIVDGGRIVNISSGLARFTVPGYAAYAVMKGGVEVLTRYLAKELAPRQISVNAFAPGAIATDFNGGAVRDNPETNQFLASVTALGRVGLPDDVGGAIALLLAPENHWITGQRIEASGGMFI